MSHVHAYIPSFLYIMILICLVLFCLSLSLSLSLSLFLSLSFVNCSMAPNRKSALSRNPLHSEAFSSDSTPSHVKFHDDKAHKDFSENFSRRNIHSERQVILSDISDIDLPTVIYSRDCESLCGISITCPSMRPNFDRGGHRPGRRLLRLLQLHPHPLLLLPQMV